MYTCVIISPLVFWEDSLNDEARELYTVPEAEKKLGKTHVTLYRWIAADKLIAVRLGGILFIPRSEIDRIKRKMETEKATTLR